MRGLLHLYGVIVAAGCAIALVLAAAITRGGAATVATAIYGFSVCLCFGTSALYHRRVWGPRGYAFMRRADHAAIFLLIAGTYTPFAVLLLPTDSARSLLTVVWSGALAGVVLQLAWPNAPRWLSVPIYIALGWTAVWYLPDMIEHSSITLLALVTAGGVAYSVGALFYALKRPNPIPHLFGHHELFHACTLLAALCHYIAAYLALVA